MLAVSACFLGLRRFIEGQACQELEQYTSNSILQFLTRRTLMPYVPLCPNQISPELLVGRFVDLSAAHALTHLLEYHPFSMW